MMSQEGHGDHWACVFESFEAVAGKWLPLFLEQGRILDSKETGRLKEGQTVGILFGEAPVAALSLVSGVLHDGALSNVFASAFPFANKGRRHRLVVKEIIPWAGCAEALVVASYPGGIGPTITFFDTRYYANRHNLNVGMEATFELAALAYAIEVVKPKPIFITDQQSIRNFRLGTDQADDPSPVEIQLDGAAILMPRDDWNADDFEFQAPVHEVEIFNALDTEITRMTVTVARMTNDEGEDISLDIDLYAANRAWRSNVRPAPGADVSGLMWLQGRMIA